MTGTIDSAVERKRDQKEDDKQDAKQIAQSGGPGEGESSATRTPREAGTRDEPRKQD